jgi:hypothetical protein
MGSNLIITSGCSYQRCYRRLIDEIRIYNVRCKKRVALEWVHEDMENVVSKLLLNWELLQVVLHSLSVASLIRGHVACIIITSSKF